MKIRLFILFILLMVNTLLYSQLSFGKEYDTLINQAESLYFAGEYNESGKRYDEAFRLNGGKFAIGGFNLDAFMAWIYADDLDKAFFYLNELIKYEWLDVDSLKTKKFFSVISVDPRWEQITNKINMRESKYRNVVKNLSEIRSHDQVLRKLIPVADTMFKSDVDKTSFYSIINIQDSINLSRVERIIATYGWLGANKIGNKANRTLWLVIQHSPLEVQEKYLPLIEESVKKGETKASALAFLTDRILVKKKRPQEYGTQLSKKNGKHEIYPVRDPANVDRRRAKLGFEPLSEYVKFFGINSLSISDMQNFDLFKSQ